MSAVPGATHDQSSRLDKGDDQNYDQSSGYEQFSNSYHRNLNNNNASFEDVGKLQSNARVKNGDSRNVDPRNMDYRNVDSRNTDSRNMDSRNMEARNQLNQNNYSQNQSSQQNMQPNTSYNFPANNTHNQSQTIQQNSNLQSDNTHAQQSNGIISDSLSNNSDSVFENTTLPYSRVSQVGGVDPNRDTLSWGHDQGFHSSRD